MSPEAQAPKGRRVIWMKHISNFVFAISALYFVYMVTVLVISSRKNSEFEGKRLGDISVEMFGGETPLARIQVYDEKFLRKQVVVLWATWCGPCHSLLMNLKDEVASGRLAKEAVLAVSIGEPLRDVAAYLEETPLPFRVALDREGHLAKRIMVQGTPTVMFLSETGVITKISTGGFGLAEKISDFAK